MPANPKGIRATKDGGLFIHPSALTVADDAAEGSSIRVPQVATELGAGFGDTITDLDRFFASKREPVAKKIVYDVARDIFDKWFTVDDPGTEGGDPKFDEAVQNALTDIETKEKLTKAVEYERLYGWSLLVGSFDDVGDIRELESPLRTSSKLLQVEAYPKTRVDVWLADSDQNSSRYMEPVVYKISRGEGSFLYVHYTRCCRVQTRSNGKSVLDPVWDDLCCGRNIRWGSAQWMYRNGGGFPVIKFPPGTTKEQLEEWVDSEAFSNLMARTYIGVTGDMDFKFEGAMGRALDPVPFFHTNLEQISAGSGIPEPMLRGAQAGALTGSEVNQQQYYKFISSIQATLETVVRWVIDLLLASRQIQVSGQQKTETESLSDKVKRWIKTDALPKPETVKYVVEWVSAFELSEIDEKQAELFAEQANEVRLKYMTVDEVRKMNDLIKLPNGEGAKLQTLQPFTPFGELEKGGEGGSDRKYTVIEHAGVQAGSDS